MSAATMSDDGFADQGLLSKESVASDDMHPIYVKSSNKRPSIIYTACCVLAGVVASLLILSIASSLKLAKHETSTNACRPSYDHVNHKPVTIDLGLDSPLQPGEEPIENGYWCGTTPEEARAKGCKFDVILYSWVPPSCYDHELQVAYLEERESEWYFQRGGEGGERVSQERAAEGVEPGLWLSWDYHDYHCQFIFRMMTRILQKPSQGVPGRVLEDYHTRHCINVLKGIEKGPEVDISTLVSLNYSTCYSKV
ncbi:MAG: hypothetical protein Q9164_003672 [Protoblastenia rupestris]